MTVEYYLNNDNQKKFFDAMGFEVYELLTLIGEKKVNVLTLDNFIDDKELNEKGLQAYRALAYDQKFEESRQKCLLYGSESHRSLKENGYIKISNVMSREKLKHLQTNILNLNTLTKKVSSNLPLLMDISSHKQMQDVFRLCQANNLYFEKSLYLRRISHSVFDEADEDSRQYNFHVDKFYPNYKVWYYPFEVKEKHGPLAFFRASHVNTVERLRWLKEKSLNQSNWSRLHYNVTDYEESAKKLKLKDEVKCSAQSNTMFIVDTRMFHRRTPTPVGTLRLSFRAILARENLF